MNGPLPAEVKFRENTGLWKVQIYVCSSAWDVVGRCSVSIIPLSVSTYYQHWRPITYNRYLACSGRDPNQESCINGSCNSSELAETLQVGKQVYKHLKYSILAKYRLQIWIWNIYVYRNMLLMIIEKSLQSIVIKADHVDPVFWSLNDILHSCRTHSLVGCSLGIERLENSSFTLQNSPANV